MSLRTAAEILDHEEQKRIDEKLEKAAYTPQFDFLLQYPNGQTISSVYGRIWRYCQMRHRQYEASVQRMAEELNLATKTVGRAIDWLAGSQKDDDGRYGNGLIIDIPPARQEQRM